MEDCVFCKIRDGLIPKEFIYQDDDVMVFPDIHPRNKVHLLFVPKKHVEEVLAVEDATIYMKLFTVLQRVAKEHKLEGEGFRVVINGGGAQEVNHLHVHLMGPVGKAVAL